MCTPTTLFEEFNVCSAEIFTNETICVMRFEIDYGSSISSSLPWKCSCALGQADLPANSCNHPSLLSFYVYRISNVRAVSLSFAGGVNTRLIWCRTAPSTSSTVVVNEPGTSITTPTVSVRAFLRYRMLKDEAPYVCPSDEPPGASRSPLRGRTLLGYHYSPVCVGIRSGDDLYD